MEHAKYSGLAAGLAAALLVAACSGGSKSTKSTGAGSGDGSSATPPRVIKKVSLQWAFVKSGAKSKIFLGVTNETGVARSYLIEEYQGDCTPIGPRTIDQAVTATRCLAELNADPSASGAGHEFHVVRNQAELIVLKIPFSNAEPLDPMAGTRLQSIPVPADAKLEAAN